MSNRWKYLLSSAAGTSHLTSFTPCQDSCRCETVSSPDGSEYLIAVVADGAGSAKCAEVGSVLACSFFGQQIKEALEKGDLLASFDREVIKQWVTSFQEQIYAKCVDRDFVPRDFASTLLAAAIGDDCGLFFQLGDGAIVIDDIEEPGSYGWVFWPQQGQYANETNFITEESAAEKIEFSIISRPINNLSVFTDGLQRLTLNYQSRQVHTPFFAPIFEWLQSAPEGYSEKYTASLTSFLNSEKINDATDDDKTVVFATRRKAVTEEDTQDDHDDQDQITAL
jgi:hypothetical protein